MDLGWKTQASQRDGQVKSWSLASSQTLNGASSLGALTSAEGHIKSVVGDDGVWVKRYLCVRRARGVGTVEVPVS